MMIESQISAIDDIFAKQDQQVQFSNISEAYLFFV
jgi:hypothetical protein